MFDIQIDDRVIIARLSYMPDRIRSTLLKKTHELAEKLKSKVQQNLTNQVLKIQTASSRATSSSR